MGDKGGGGGGVGGRMSISLDRSPNPVLVRIGDELFIASTSRHNSVNFDPGDFAFIQTSGSVSNPVPTTSTVRSRSRSRDGVTAGDGDALSLVLTTGSGGAGGHRDSRTIMDPISGTTFHPLDMERGQSLSDTDLEEDLIQHLNRTRRKVYNSTRRSPGTFGPDRPLRRAASKQTSNEVRHESSVTTDPQTLLTYTKCFLIAAYFVFLCGSGISLDELVRFMMPSGTNTRIISMVIMFFLGSLCLVGLYGAAKEDSCVLLVYGIVVLVLFVLHVILLFLMKHLCSNTQHTCYNNMATPPGLAPILVAISELAIAMCAFFMTLVIESDRKVRPVIANAGSSGPSSSLPNAGQTNGSFRGHNRATVHGPHVSGHRGSSGHFLHPQQLQVQLLQLQQLHHLVEGEGSLGSGTSGGNNGSDIVKDRSSFGNTLHLPPNMEQDVAINMNNLRRSNSSRESGRRYHHRPSLGQLDIARSIREANSKPLLSPPPFSPPTMSSESDGPILHVPTSLKEGDPSQPPSGPLEHEPKNTLQYPSSSSPSPFPFVQVDMVATSPPQDEELLPPDHKPPPPPPCSPPH